MAADQPQPELVTGRLAVYSADRTLAAYPDRTRGLAVIERLSDGQQWEIDSGEHPVYFSPDSRRILWEDYNEDAPRDTRLETLWLADVDGSNARQLFSGRRTGPVAWLPNDGLLMARGFAGTSDLELFRLSLVDGTQRRMLRLPRFRGVDLSPDRRQMVYYVYREADPTRNGVWLLNLESRIPKPQKLPFFGTYRWRDNERLVYVPFDPAATEHTFFEYNITTQQTRPLFPQGTGLTIANNDWQVSPDGSQIALVAAAGTKLDGIWILDLN
ncbi:MAG: hypothetical protein D6768_10620 [Chloroflexi bacterium]|nr:MAG: hypothetical protein D6768_10620 [Chloroflexota bacterium]